MRTGNTMLPTSAPADLANTDNTAESKGKKHSYNLLFVDDEFAVLKALKRIFVGEDYNILTAEDATSAFDLLYKHNIALIICDFRMPGMSGAEFLKKVKEKFPDIIKILITGATDVAIVKDLIDTGILYKYLTKPWNPDDLLLSVKLALKQYDLITENNNLKKLSNYQSDELKKIRRFATYKLSPLSGLLLKTNKMLPAQLEMVKTYCQNNNLVLIKGLIDLKMIPITAVQSVITDNSHYKIESINLSKLDPHLKDVLPKEICLSGGLVPLSIKNHTIKLAMADPLDIPRLDYIQFLTGLNTSVIMTDLKDINQAIDIIYKKTKSTIESENFELYESLEVEDNDVEIILDSEHIDSPEQILARSTSSSAVSIVNSIIAKAIAGNVSDIHIEPKIDMTLVRYRIDGLLSDYIKIPAKTHLSVLSRLKVLAKMDISLRRVPQDGRISVKVNNREIDMRISTMPTLYGEKAVCRLLDKNATVKSIDDLGIHKSAHLLLKKIIKLPQGIIIATGPTGSGKTTSLYSLMNERLTSDQNFVTIEDPVEYFLGPASQVHIANKAGLTFASTLRATLRQDPDVILVGEIRDLETAQIAFQAAMTGHLVFTSLHTNNTLAAITRLLNLGIEPFLVASAVEGIIAQRLVRKICTNCKEEKPIDKEIIVTLGYEPDQFKKIYYGKGCPACGASGYKGRTGLFELLHLSEEFRQLLTSNFHESQLVDLAQKQGMITLRHDAREKLLNGETTPEEILRVLGPSISFTRECENCHKLLESGFVTCPYCGQKNKNICPKCQTRLKPEWQTCPYCL